jgi:8-oxo-dGTP diphosphatase
MHYVVGFVFCYHRILLIKKNRPAYLAGKLNGIGGGVERGELASTAMAREMHEEAGLKTLPGDWLPVATLNTLRGDRIDFFAAHWRDEMGEARSCTAEPVGWYSSHLLGSDVPVFENLPYLIPLARTALDNPTLPAWLIYEDRR